MMKTSYMNAKLTPVFFMLRDIRSRSGFFKLSLEYKKSNNWQYAVGALIVDASEDVAGFGVFNNKDHLFFNISYRWG